MFQIRREHAQALAASLIQTGNRSLAARLKLRFPDLFHPGDETALYELVQEARAVARQYGITREDNVATFLDLTVMYGKDFHQSAWFGRVLRHKALHGPDKMTLVAFLVKQTGVSL